MSQNDKADLVGAMEGRKSPMGPAAIIAACSIGNMLEWYDIVLYSYLGVYIGKAFFPASSPATSLLLTFGTFALGYLIRPIGALILGAYADTAGRKPALVLTLYLMTAGTVLLAIVPPYSAIGVAAPLLVLLSRLLQGFSAGGEFGAATTMMIEHLPIRRGLAASFQFVSQGGSSLLSALVGLLLTSNLSAHQISSWGFRVAFLGGALIGPIALYIRRTLPESPEFIAGQHQQRRERQSIWRPARDLLSTHLVTVLLLIGIAGLGSSLTYIMSYIPTYSINTLKLPAYVGFAAVMITAGLQIVLYPISGRASDRFGKPKQMIIGAVILFVISYPIFGTIAAVATVAVLFALLAVLEVFKAWFSAPSAALQGILFPASARGIGLAFSYNCGVAIFGGLTPFMAQLLIGSTKQDAAPAYWLMFTAIVAVVCLAIVMRRYRDQVREPMQRSSVSNDLIPE